MADLKQIQFKRSKTAGAKPTTAQIAEGELAINLKDRTIFTNDGSQIIDLGFAKGGQIDGDVTQVGNYTQTGNYTTSGDISAKTLLVSSGVESQGDIRANSGVFRTRANAASNAHLWFEGIEVGTGKNFERGVMYAPPQQANAGAINLRVLNGTATDSGQALFSWRGDGDFNIPRDFLGQRARLAIEAVAPTFNGGRLYTRDRTWNQFGTNESYGWNDLVGYTVGQNGALALNYVYKGRAHLTGTIWHHLIDEREAPEWALYTGGTPDRKMFSIRSVGNLGHAQVTGSLFLGPGGGGLGVTSGMGQGSLALGDNDTGFRSDADGAFSVMGNSRALVHYNASAAKFQIEHRKATRITHTDNSNTTILPPNNTSILEVDTSLDGNNVGGNGLTLLGYVSSGRYYHYFRGTGGASFDMDSGVNITKGGLTVSGTASASRFDSLGDIAFKNPVNRHIRFEYTNTSGAVAVDGYIFKDGPSNTSRRPGIRVNCSAPNSSVGSGDFVFGEDGHFTVPRQVKPGDFSNFDSRYQNLLQLGANVNLDTLAGDNHAGEYAQHANANTSLALNYPEALAGHLTVTSGAGVQQRYHVYNSTRVYLRAKYSSDSWRPWDRVVTEDYLKTGIPSQFVSKNSDGFRIAYGSYGFFIRNDGGNTYFMLTNSGDQMGTWNGLRPLTISNSTGQVTIGTPLVVTHASGLTVNSTAGNAISWGSLGACLANDGNLKGTRWNSFGGSEWVGDALNWVNNQNVAKAGDTMSGILTIQANGGALRLNATASNQSVYVLGQRAGVNGFYMGFGGSGNDLTLHNYLLNTTINLRASDIQFSRTVYGNGDANFNNVYIRSDITLKRNFKKIENALDKVDKLEGLIYEKKNSRESTEYETTEAGIIAQSLQAVLPEAVAEHEGVLNVSASGTIALLVNAIKELKARVEYLESK
ncbi:tail fiber [Kosakonia phage 305]|uniref:Long tail fiber protein Gp37 n=1 Tax=Kosakonia phage 305 TaxID=2863193 RepID=A0AAE8BIU5_9CAUD|nr:tail fiber protein [Kosakonia phage 305]QYN80424.1 tail fiber [Kosakonia phage 305]